MPTKIVAKALLNALFQRVIALPVLVLPFLFTIVAVLFSLTNLESITWIILAVGFFTVGLSHGALDHLTSKTIINKKELFYFIIKYLLKSLLLGLCWLVLPDLALFVFIGFSAWHFGQADFKEWQLKVGWQSFLWGSVLILVILIFHFDELIAILEQIPNLSSLQLLKNVSENQITTLQISVISFGLFLAVYSKSKYLFFTLLYLLLSSMLPLLVSFGIYFVYQHSIHGWFHLLKGLNLSSSKLWIKSFPFSIIGALILLGFFLFGGLNYIGMFFIVLSCLSLPHVLGMHYFYTSTKPKKKSILKSIKES